MRVETQMRIAEGTTVELPCDMPRTGDLAKRVREVLSMQGVPSLRRLDVVIDADTVVVSGRVPTFYAKQLAANRCRHLVGPHRIRLDVEVA